MGRPNIEDESLGGQATQILIPRSKSTFSKGSPKYTGCSKASSFTKQDDESSSTSCDNEVHYENPMYESLMAEDSIASAVSPVMVIRRLSIKEQLANLIRLVEGLAKRTQE
ncbi:hypothetical protein M9H77_18548 [Catharanthus roseus]|uniref:Uncharacterized protein n=1 Tax=Catharanthus roseus TaxID=4058 RepID=A0ACC0B821_CATRO|nr:hypothetical protein M9H77_18548 [Catharanthus roseus]